MTRVEVYTCQVSIFIAGDYDTARAACRAFCFEQGLCVTVTPTSYIYTGGEEQGVVVGLINYPRFPSTEEALLVTAERLAEHLRGHLCQHSYTITAPSKTVWVTRRESSLPQHPTT